tara:strand:+ start:439 stop:684 length:246 start_codon:yes stop_codon:yes gene_type:complete
MQLRSGKLVNKTDRETTEAAETLLYLYNKENIAKQHPLYQLCVNEKLKTAPQILQEKCSDSLRKIVEESVLKGINIKFEIQ